MTPISFSVSAIITSGANQISASQARCSASRSFHVSTRASRIAETPASATNVFEMPCHGLVTHPAITPSMIATSHFSSRLSGPIAANSARASSRAADGIADLRLHPANSSQGTIASVSSPGTIEPENHRIQVRSTCPTLDANSAISGFAAMPVRNMAEAV